MTGLLAWCCPCYLVGNIAEVVGENKTLCCLGACASLHFLPVGYLAIRCVLRGKVREQRGIKVRLTSERYLCLTANVLLALLLCFILVFQGDLGTDFLYVWLCGLCSLVQEARVSISAWW